MKTDKRLLRAAQAIHDRIEKLAEEIAKDVPAYVCALLRAIRDRCCESEDPLYEICRDVGATEWHMKVFKRELGITAGKLLLRLRLETAFLLLRDTTMSVPEIAILVGYETVGAMGKLFTSVAGLPPSEVRFHLRRIVPEQRAQCEELLSWCFRIRYHRGKLTAEHFRDALAFFKGRLGPT